MTYAKLLDLEERFVDVKGVQMRYFVGGEGPPLLLIHGLGGAASNWTELAPLLLERYRLLVPDLPGHGGSTALPAVSGLEPFADRVALVAGGHAARTGRRPLARRHGRPAAGVAQARRRAGGRARGRGRAERRERLGTPAAVDLHLRPAGTPGGALPRPRVALAAAAAPRVWFRLRRGSRRPDRRGRRRVPRRTALAHRRGQRLAGPPPGRPPPGARTRALSGARPLGLRGRPAAARRRFRVHAPPRRAATRDPGLRSPSDRRAAGRVRRCD